MFPASRDELVSPTERKDFNNVHLAALMKTESERSERFERAFRIYDRAGPAKGDEMQIALVGECRADTP